MNDNTHTASFRRKNIGEPSSAQSVRGIFALPGAMPDAAAIAALVGTADLKACFATALSDRLEAERDGAATVSSSPSSEAPAPPCGANGILPV